MTFWKRCLISGLKLNNGLMILFLQNILISSSNPIESPLFRIIWARVWWRNFPKFNTHVMVGPCFFIWTRKNQSWQAIIIPFSFLCSAIQPIKRTFFCSCQDNTRQVELILLSYFYHVQHTIEQQCKNNVFFTVFNFKRWMIIICHG